MTRYFRQVFQAFEALIRRINDAVKRSFERVAESSVPAVLLFATLGLCAGLSFWLSPQVWLAKFETVAARVRKLLDFGTTLLDYAAANPVVAAIVAVIHHPVFARVLSLLAVACLLYLWARDESTERVRERRIAAGQSLTRSERIHLFAHRLAAVIILLLLIFPGLVIFFADPFIVLMFALVLAAIYGAIRLSWNLLRSLAEEVRDNTLSRSRMDEAEQCLQFLDDDAAQRAKAHHSANWLQHYIQAAFARKLCIEIVCGTCGSTPFKNGLVQLASGGSYQDVVDVDQNALKEIASALAQIPLDTQLGDTQHDSDRAIMSIIYFLWSRSRDFRRDIEPVLSGSRAGEVLKSMQAHYAHVQAGRHAHDAMNDPRYVQRQRSLRKAETQLQHAARQARRAR